MAVKVLLSQDWTLSSLPNSSQPKRFLKLKERTGNVYDNKGNWGSKLQQPKRILPVETFGRQEFSGWERCALRLHGRQPILGFSFQGDTNKLAAGLRARFFKQLPDHIFYGTLRNPQLGGDLRVR